MSLSTTSEHAGDIIKAAPPASVAGLSLLGLPLNEWVVILTIIYLLMQMGWFLYSKIIRKAKDVSE